MSVEHRDTVLRLIMDHIDARSTDALVVDRWGTSDVVDWDSLVAGEAVELRVIPDVLLLDEAQEFRYPDLAPHAAKRFGSLVAFDTADLLTR